MRTQDNILIIIETQLPKNTSSFASIKYQSVKPVQSYFL